MSACSRTATTRFVPTPELTKDQKAAAEQLWAAVKAADDENIAWLKEIVEKYGWPTKRIVGPDLAARHMKKPHKGSASLRGLCDSRGHRSCRNEKDSGPAGRLQCTHEKPRKGCCSRRGLK